MSPVFAVSHTVVVTVSIGLKNILLTLFQPSLTVGEQDWERASFQIGVSGLVQLLMEGRLRHAGGPARISSSLLH